MIFISRAFKVGLWVCLLSAVVLGEEPGVRQRNFLRALEVFDGAKTPDDYRQSAQLLETILSDGFKNGAIFYNLGNAYFRAGDFGKAILNYRKAKLYRPRDPYVQANLQQALAMAPGRLIDQTDSWWTRVLFWNDWLSVSSKAYLAAFGVAATAFIVLMGFWLRKIFFFWIALVTMVVFGVIVVDYALSSPELLGARRAIIVREVIARKGTGNAYEPAFDKPLLDGAEFTILSETEGWTLGHFESIGDGWVQNDCVAR
jgi:hypothetical protein